MWKKPNISLIRQKSSLVWTFSNSGKRLNFYSERSSYREMFRKKPLVKIRQNLQEMTVVGVSFFCDIRYDLQARVQNTVLTL